MDTERSGSVNVGRTGAVGRLGERLLYGLLFLAGLVAMYFILAAAVPRWWSHRMGEAIGGRMLSGLSMGLLIGFVCTVVPLGLAWWGLRRQRSSAVTLMSIILAVVAALPNLFTLSVVLGRGEGAHAGQRVMDVEAPWFLGGTGIGAIVAALVFLGSVMSAASRRRTKVGRQRDAEELARHRAAAVERGEVIEQPRKGWFRSGDRERL